MSRCLTRWGDLDTHPWKQSSASSLIRLFSFCICYIYQPMVKYASSWPIRAHLLSSWRFLVLGESSLSGTFLLHIYLAPRIDVFYSVLPFLCVSQTTLVAIWLGHLSIKYAQLLCLYLISVIRGLSDITFLSSFLACRTQPLLRFLIKLLCSSYSIPCFHCKWTVFCIVL